MRIQLAFPAILWSESPTAVTCRHSGPYFILTDRPVKQVWRSVTGRWLLTWTFEPGKTPYFTWRRAYGTGRSISAALSGPAFVPPDLGERRLTFPSQWLVTDPRVGANHLIFFFSARKNEPDQVKDCETTKTGTGRLDVLVDNEHCVRSKVDHFQPSMKRVKDDCKDIHLNLGESQSKAVLIWVRLSSGQPISIELKFGASPGSQVRMQNCQ